MFKTIAFATDGSPSALNALTRAKELARESGAKLVIVHVEELLFSRAGALDDSHEAVLASLLRTADELQGEGIDAAVSSARAPSSGVAQMIVDLASEAGADVIVVGNRGHGPIARLLLGSVATRLLQIAPIPVLMVPSRVSSTSLW
jgi:nucleotide-binding universal stress UspA family protein